MVSAQLRGSGSFLVLRIACPLTLMLSPSPCFDSPLQPSPPLATSGTLSFLRSASALSALLDSELHPALPSAQRKRLYASTLRHQQPALLSDAVWLPQLSLVLRSSFTFAFLCWVADNSLHSSDLAFCLLAQLSSLSAHWVIGNRQGRDSPLCNVDIFCSGSREMPLRRAFFVSFRVGVVVPWLVEVSRSDTHNGGSCVRFRAS